MVISLDLSNSKVKPGSQYAPLKILVWIKARLLVADTGLFRSTNTVVTIVSLPFRSVFLQAVPETTADLRIRPAFCLSILSPMRGGCVGFRVQLMAVVAPVPGVDRSLGL